MERRIKLIPDRYRYVAKAIASGIAALVGSLLLVMTGNETFSDVSQVEWLVVVANVLTVYGVTWRTPNE